MKEKEKFYKTFEKLHASPDILTEVLNMTADSKVVSIKKKKKRFSHVAVVAIACLALAGAGTAAYAAARYFGIFDFNERMSVKIPEEAIPMIQMEFDEIEKNDTIFELSVKEALCDSKSISIVLEMTAKESDKYLFVPEDAMPEDLMINWIPEGDEKTAGEYASEKNLTIVNIGGSIRNWEELGIVSQMKDFLAVDDDTMDVYITCGIDGAAENYKALISATAFSPNSSIKMKSETEIELQNQSTSSSKKYTCEWNESDKYVFKIEYCEVTESEVGTYVDIYYINQDESDGNNCLVLQVVDEEGNVLPAKDGSAYQIEGDHYICRWTLENGVIGDKLYIQAYDVAQNIIYLTKELTRE